MSKKYPWFIKESEDDNPYDYGSTNYNRWKEGLDKVPGLEEANKSDEAMEEEKAKIGFGLSKGTLIRMGREAFLNGRNNNPFSNIRPFANIREYLFWQEGWNMANKEDCKTREAKKVRTIHIACPCCESLLSLKLEGD